MNIILKSYIPNAKLTALGEGVVVNLVNQLRTF